MGIVDSTKQEGTELTFLEQKIAECDAELERITQEIKPLVEEIEEKESYKNQVEFMKEALHAALTGEAYPTRPRQRQQRKRTMLNRRSQEQMDDLLRRLVSNRQRLGERFTSADIRAVLNIERKAADSLVQKAKKEKIITLIDKAFSPRGPKINIYTFTDRLELVDQRLQQQIH